MTPPFLLICKITASRNCRQNYYRMAGKLISKT